MSMDAPLLRHGPIPVPRSTLIGREREVSDITALLHRDDVPLVTVTGPGGVGKTRVAMHVATRVATAFADGAVFVDLSVARDPDDVVPTIARAMGLADEGVASDAEQIFGTLASRSLLLVLDNFEQVVASASDVADLLVTSPEVKVLATSRVSLRLSFEYDYPLTPLGATDAMLLFEQRARRVVSGFALSDENSPIIEAICQRLDGLPLAIELAAARVAVLPPKALLARLERALPLLTGGSRDLPDRLRTMRNAIAWSHNLLTTEERVLFRRLAVFEGGFSLDGAEDVAVSPSSIRGGYGALHGSPGILQISTLDGVASLIDKSLVTQPGAHGDQPRYRMLETIREFGLERLMASGEEGAVRTAHARFALDQAVRQRARLFSPDCEDALARLELEHDNMRSALRWAEATKDLELGVGLTGALASFWIFRGHFREGRRWHEIWLERIPEEMATVRAASLARCGWLAVLQGDVTAARSILNNALDTARASQAEVHVASAMLAMGFVDLQLDSHDSAISWTTQALERYRELEDFADEAPFFVGLALAHLGQIHVNRREARVAREHIEQAIGIQRSLGFVWGLGDALRLLGHVDRQLGDHNAAREHYREAMVLGRNVHDPRMMSETVAGVAALLIAKREFEHAARLFGVVAAMRRSIGTLESGWGPAEYEQNIALVREALAPDAFDRCWGEGVRLSFADGVSEAITRCDGLDGPETPASVMPEPVMAAGLTDRELDVLRLLVQGKSDKEIADALYLSPRTVGGYVSSLLAKFDVETRTAVAVLAVRQGHV